MFDPHFSCDIPRTWHRNFLSTLEVGPRTLYPKFISLKDALNLSRLMLLGNVLPMPSCHLPRSRRFVGIWAAFEMKCRRRIENFNKWTGLCIFSQSASLKSTKSPSHHL